MITFAPAFEELFRPHRYKVFYGGRGCIEGNTKIYTPAGKIKVKDFSGGMVYVCDGASVRVAFASAPKKYEAEDLYKISTASYSITVTAKHKFLTDRGWVNACNLQIDQDRLACVSPRASLASFSPFQTIVDNAPSAFLQDVGHCLRIIQGWICRYWLDFRPDGEQPRLLSGIDLNVLPLQDDVLQHKSHISSQKDDPERAYIDALICQILSHLENLPALQDEAEKSFAAQENYIFGRFSELFSALHEALTQFHKYSNPASITHKYAELVQAFYTRASQDGTLEKVPVLRQFFSLDSSFSSSFVGCNLTHHIITQEFVKSITFVEKEEFYDLQIPFYENYIANGFINHNSGKSWSVARALLLLGYEKPMRILCAREIQRSISDSVHKLLCEQIEAIGLSGAYTITRDAIRCTSGTEFIFKGLRSNPQEIKSTEGIDICWVEEAAAVSADSWDILIPTVRKPNSEIWLTFNPLDESDPTYQRFVLNAPDDAYVCKVNYDGNPAFPDVLKKEMEWLKSRDYESYLHIWEGEVRKHSNAVIFAGRFRVEEFETPKDARFYQGADWGFASDPSCLVRCFIQDRTIFIDREAWGVGVDLDETPALFDIVETARTWPIKADNARPETISFMRRRGFNISAAKKWAGSIEDGIEFLKSYDIVIHPRCRHAIDEFNHYSYKVDKQTGDVLPIVVDSFNHIIDATRYALADLMRGRGQMQINPAALMMR